MTWFITRAISILTQPKIEWAKIKGEQTSYGALLMRYALPLCCLLFVSSILTVFLRDPRVIPFLVILNVLVLSASVFLIHIGAIVIQTLATNVGGTCTQLEAGKLSCYSATPLIVLFSLTPLIGPLFLLGVPWAAYLFAIGCSELILVPQGGRIRFMAGTILMMISAILMAYLFISGIIAMIVGPQAA